ncbi:hypothetical protein [Oecophyllibacter saccharovorans]|uniref:hypothetical protein n=1 Tax=Oecophyllibacter saccharovorans TaxID=2558360 RepID=UPI001E5DA1E1|nr:hypothetical protein [Oecophyllibacter saccharovorans]
MTDTTDTHAAPPTSAAGASTSEGARQVRLVPESLPALDILTLAQEGRILRAERETPPDGVPVFVTRAGWDELLSHHGKGEPEEKVALTKLLPALEQISARLLAQAAEASEHHAKPAAQENAPKAPPSIFTLESDLFPSDPQTRLVLVRDRTHPVVCALLGTPAQLATLLPAQPHGGNPPADPSHPG